jgi:hypothetical protein
MNLTTEQIAILDHTTYRAARGCFCGDSPDMQVLVAAGLMKSAGRIPICPDEYFRITLEGLAALREAKEAQPLPMHEVLLQPSEARNPIYIEYYAHAACDCYKIDVPWTKFAKHTVVLCRESLGYEHAKKLAQMAIGEHLAGALNQPVEQK